MAVIARDTFSGDADTDITGRTPDGGLDPTTGIGTWAGTTLTGSVCCIDVVPPVGAQASASVALTDDHALLTGLGLTTDDILVRVTGSITGTGGWFGSLLNHQASAVNDQLTSYELLLIKDGATYGVFLYENGSNGVGAPTFFTLESKTDLTLADGPHTLELVRGGSQLLGSLDGVLQFVHTLGNPDTDVYPIATGGDPGLCISNATTLARNVAVTLFEVETQGLVPDGPCTSGSLQAVYSQDCFQGATTLGGIENRLPDGCEAECVSQGAWHNVLMSFRTNPPSHCEIGHQIGDNFSTLVHVNPTGAQPWNHEAVEDIANLGSDYTVEVEGYFAQMFEFAAVPERYAWISCLARQQSISSSDPGFLENFTAIGSSSYIVPQGIDALYVECRQGGAAGGGATGNPAAGGGGAGGTYAAKRIAVTPGETLTVIVGAARTGTTGNGGAGNFSAIQRAGVDLVRADGAQGGTAATVNSTNGAGGAANTTGSIGDVIQAGTPGSTGNFTPGAAGGQGGNSGAPFGNTGIGGAAAPDSSVGRTGTSPGGGGGGGKANTTTDRAGGQGAQGRVTLNPNVGRGGHATESGWEFFMDNAGAVEGASGQVHFIYFINGLYSHVNVFQDFPITAGETFRLKLCCKGNTFCFYINDQFIGSRVDDRWPTGFPGLCAMDSSEGTIVRITRWKVASDEANAPLCGPGDGGGHGGGGDGGEETPTFLWPMGKGGWRPVPVPIDAPTSRVRPYGRGAPRGSVPTGIYSKGAWRSLLPPGTGGGIPGGPDDTGTTDPGDALFDPGCGVTEATPPVPPVTGPPLPLSDRFFGISNFIPPNAGELFNGFKNTVGAWTPSDLAFLASRNSHLMTAQGGYAKFLVNGRFDRSHFLSVTLDMLLPRASVLQSYTDSGTHFAYSFIDDFDSGKLWPPSGVSDTDLVWIMNGIRAAVPGIRVGLRGRPSQFSTNLGFDFYGSQYVSWHGDAFDVARSEYSRAAGWGSLITLDLNYIAGGNGSSGIRWFSNPKWYVCSPSEVREYLTAMFTAADSVDGARYLAGSLGYQWDTRFFNITGMVDALIAGRNVLANLPPLP